MPTDSATPSAVPPPLPDTLKPSLPPGIGKVLLLCVVFYGVTILGSIAEMALSAVLGGELDPAASLFFQLLFAWIITLWISTVIAAQFWKNSYLLCSFPKSYCAPTVLAGFGLSITLSEATTFIPMPEFVQEFFLSLMKGNRVFVFLSLCVMAPVMEELFFRGFVLRNFLQRYSLRKAVVASSLIFAAFHLNPWQIVVAFPAGLLAAWLVLRTGSLLPGMLAHFSINFTSAFILFPLAALFGVSQEELIDHDHFPRQVLVIGAIATAAGLLWLFKTAGRQTTNQPPAVTM